MCACVCVCLGGREAEGVTIGRLRGCGSDHEMGGQEGEIVLRQAGQGMGREFADVCLGERKK